MKKALTFLVTILFILVLSSCSQSKELSSLESSVSEKSSSSSQTSSSSEVSIKDDTKKISGMVNSSQISDDLVFADREYKKDGHSVLVVNITVENINPEDKGKTLATIMSSSIVTIKNKTYPTNESSSTTIDTIYSSKGPESLAYTCNQIFYIPNDVAEKPMTYQLLGEGFGGDKYIIDENLTLEKTSQSTDADTTIPASSNKTVITYDGKNHTVSIGEIGNDDAGDTTVTFLIAEGVGSIKFKNGAFTPPISSEIVVAGETISSKVFTINTSNIVFAYNTQSPPDKIIVYSSDATDSPKITFDPNSKTVITE